MLVALTGDPTPMLVARSGEPTPMLERLNGEPTPMLERLNGEPTPMLDRNVLVTLDGLDLGRIRLPQSNAARPRIRV